MNTHRLVLAFLLQFLVAAPAFAWSFFEDSSQESREVWRCQPYQQLPVQSRETKKETEEEQEPDCE